MPWKSRMFVLIFVYFPAVIVQPSITYLISITFNALFSFSGHNHVFGGVGIEESGWAQGRGEEDSWGRFAGNDWLIDLVANYWLIEYMIEWMIGDLQQINDLTPPANEEAVDPSQIYRLDDILSPDQVPLFINTVNQHLHKSSEVSCAKHWFGNLYHHCRTWKSV